ncbi:MAG TPA: energy transducer TonB [Candidatus Angelobacter sp.]|nr:energy transducer TonB [Candidatus Angelobacter sp.]
MLATVFLLLSTVFQNTYNPDVADCRDIGFDAPAGEVKGPCFWIGDGQKIYRVGHGVPSPRPKGSAVLYVDRKDIPDVKARKPEALKVRIDRAGNLQVLEIVRSISPSVDGIALREAPKWKFEPVVFNGNTVTVEFNVIVPIYFKNGKCYIC